ncbi:MAG TPA: hypothetical protein H9948_04840 [Candidatus Jeotgalibaca merdavium]|uniref:Uncharacterized protein n=1 Tax=Candidatus Jeotgalibaca merdavium TaxID=2838627 RepID=A0A9D2I0P8_9LACT|nr:hypothetical protein [Candidatus Jeotgalibaca merdavium]
MKKKYVIKTVYGYLVEFEMIGENIEGVDYNNDKTKAYAFQNILLLNRVKNALILENAEVEEL